MWNYFVNKIDLVTFMCPSAELTWVEGGSWLFLLMKLKTLEPSEKFRVKSSSIFYPYSLFMIKIVLNFDKKTVNFKTRKSQGSPLSWNLKSTKHLGT